MTKAVLEAEARARPSGRRGGSVPHTRGPGEPAGIADGAARPAWACQGGGADRRGHWARVFARAAGCGGAQAENQQFGARPPHSRRFAVPAGRAAARDLPVQARLVQDAAYGTLLREPRRALHARIAETLESQFAEIAENQPELLARHCTEAGLTEKAANLWGKAGQRSLERSALVEAIEQFTRASPRSRPCLPRQRRSKSSSGRAVTTHIKARARNQGGAGTR